MDHYCRTECATSRKYARCKISITRVGQRIMVAGWPLVTSIPVTDAIMAVKQRLNTDKDLHVRTQLNIDQIVELLAFCLNTTYFVYIEELLQPKTWLCYGLTCVNYSS